MTTLLIILLILLLLGGGYGWRGGHIGAGGFSIVGVIVIVLVILLLTGRLNGAPVTLEWDSNSEPDVQLYRLTVVADRVPFSPVAIVEIRGANRATADLPSGITYGATVTAENTAGLESGPSNRVTFQTGQILQVTLYSSPDLRTWSVESVRDASERARFWRVGIAPKTP